MLYLWLIVFSYSFVFSEDISFLSINNKEYSVNDFFARYPKKQWERADSLQKSRVFNDFITRELCVFEAKKLGLHNHPDVAIKIYNRSLQILVNESYESFVANPLITNEELKLARKYAKSEVFVNHILIGHSVSYLASPPKRSSDEALILAQNIINKISNGENFAVLAEKYSDDPSVKQNSGKVGWVSWGSTVPNFQKAAFSLELDKVSMPVLTDFGYHIILVTQTRPSDYSLMEKEEYENLILNISKNSIRNKLRPAAIEYDKKMIDEYSVKFDMNIVNNIYNDYLKTITNNLNQAKSVSLSFLENVSPEVVCLYNNNAIGPKWFYRMHQRGTSRLSSFSSPEDILSLFKTYILQDIAIKKGVSAKINKSFSYNLKINNMIDDLLYDSYLKHIKESSILPDTLEIKKYYNKNKLNLYMSDEKVIIKELRVNNKYLADSLLIELKKGTSFDILLSNITENNDSSYIIGPFSRKQAPKYYDITKSLQIGENSPVFKSTNSSFSIVLLLDRIVSKPSSFNEVYKEIESVLIKDYQRLNKENKLNNLINNHTVIKNINILNK